VSNAYICIYVSRENSAYTILYNFFNLLTKMLLARFHILFLSFNIVFLMSQFLIDWIFRKGMTFDLDPERWVRLCQVKIGKGQVEQ